MDDDIEERHHETDKADETNDDDSTHHFRAGKDAGHEPELILPSTAELGD